MYERMSETLDKGHTISSITAPQDDKDCKCNDLIKNLAMSPRRGWTPKRIDRPTSSLVAIDLDMDEVAVHRNCLEKDKSDGQTADPLCV
jgi:hypothetical protein